MMGEDHTNDIEYPDDVPTKDHSNKSAYPVTLFESSNKSKNPRSDWDDT